MLKLRLAAILLMLLVLTLTSVVYSMNYVLEVVSQAPADLKIVSSTGKIVAQCLHAKTCVAVVPSGTYYIYASWNGLSDIVKVNVNDATVIYLGWFFYLKKLVQLVGIGLVLFGVAYAANEYCKVRRHLSSIMMELPVQYQKPMRVLKVRIKLEELRRGRKLEVEDIIMRRAKVRAQARKISDKVLEEVLARTVTSQSQSSLSVRKFVVPEGVVIEVLPRMITTKEEEEASVMAGLEKVHAPKAEQKVSEKEYLSDTLR